MMIAFVSALVMFGMGALFAGLALLADVSKEVYLAYLFHRRHQ